MSEEKRGGMLMVGVLVGLGVIVLGVFGVKYGIAAIITGITAITVGLGIKKD